MPLLVDVVTAERSVLSDTADMVVAPSVDGTVGILPHHARMIALLKPGELRLKRGPEEVALAVSGGVLQVESDHVTVLADAAERAEEVDVTRAREALERARRHMAELKDHQAQAAVQAAIERATVRLRVAERRRRTRPVPETSP